MVTRIPRRVVVRQTSGGPAPDAVEEAGLESFPASDAPAWGRAAGNAAGDTLPSPSSVARGPDGADPTLRRIRMATTYTSHVLPLFRSGDISCMAPMGVKLGNADWMCDPLAGHEFADHGNARNVFAALAGRSMPPDRPWSPSQLDAYDQWMRDGFAR